MKEEVTENKIESNKDVRMHLSWRGDDDDERKSAVNKNWCGVYNLKIKVRATRNSEKKRKTIERGGLIKLYAINSHALWCRYCIQPLLFCYFGVRTVIKKFKREQMSASSCKLGHGCPTKKLFFKTTNSKDFACKKICFNDDWLNNLLTCV